ncbi:MAG TPA: FtsW/RodA/SpoVE family cell cycle protein, partial [Solirubrobacteraceae bacterium]
MPAPLTSPIKAPEGTEQPAARGGASDPGRRFALPLDPLLTLAVVGLGIASAMTLGTATREAVAGDPSYYVTRQVVYLAIGLILMVVLARVDYARLRPLKNGIYALLILSILAVLGLGHEAKGATRAISLPFFSFQASELGKVLLILALATLIVDRARRLRERDTTVRVMLAALVPAMLVIAQPDLGSGMVYMAVAFVMLLVAGAPWQQLGGLVALVCVSVAVVLVAAPALGVHVLKPYQAERLTAFLHPSSNFAEIKEKESKTGEPDPRYQLAQSKIAIGSGQKTGRGSADSTQLTGNYLPEDDTDFVFAAVGEQYGFLGAGLVLCLYGLLIWRTLRILVMSKDLFGSLVAGGVAAMLMFQVFVNVGMTIGIMPITGVTLPLMSYGGSSVITTLLAVGLL